MFGYDLTPSSSRVSISLRVGKNAHSMNARLHTGEWAESLVKKHSSPSLIRKRLFQRSQDSSRQDVCGPCTDVFLLLACYFPHYTLCLLQVVNTLSCAHPHCQSTFAGVDDLISHLVNFHCQLQFRPRRLTFVSVEKYEVKSLRWGFIRDSVFFQIFLELEIHPWEDEWNNNGWTRWSGREWRWTR